MDLKDLVVFQLAMELGEKIWKIVSSFEDFSKRTLGSQLVRSSDSIAANISEGFGRYHYKEAINFYYYARGSFYETSTWLVKAKNRGLVSNKEYSELEASMKTLGIKLNNFISTVGKKSSSTINDH